MLMNHLVHSSDCQNNLPDLNPLKIYFSITKFLSSVFSNLNRNDCALGRLTRIVSRMLSYLFLWLLDNFDSNPKMTLCRGKTDCKYFSNRPASVDSVFQSKSLNAV